ncbi:porin family protein [Balneola sp. MJW-20]|uniref:porin family protein n=1 Tax=Gracilimonas aurantiaca TaxID=3234185 RepID=UPI003464FAA6
MRSFKRLLSPLLLTVIIFASSTGIKAQLIPQIGLKGGLSLSTITDTDDAERIPRLVGGLYARVNIPGSAISIQPEVLYAQYGADVTFGRIELDYIQVPVLANFQMSVPSASIRPWIEFGPYFSWSINKNFEANESNTVSGITELINDSEYGAVIGAGVDFSKFIFGVRYTFGLVDVFDESISDSEVNGALQVTAAYRLF